MKIVICILFFTLSVAAQNTNSEFHKTVDSINAILKANPLSYYTDNKQNSAFIKKISANEQGIVTFTDSIPKTERKEKELLPDCCRPKRIRTLDLFVVKKWDIYFPNAYLKDKNNQTNGRIIGFRKEDLYKLKVQFDKLTTLCRKGETETKL